MVATVLFALDARADRPRVAVFVSGPADEQALEIKTRLRAELAGAGFESVSVQLTVEGHDSVEDAARRTGSVAAIGVNRFGGVDAEVWVADRVTGKTVLRRVAVQSLTADAAAIFAIRAVELLKASLLELEESHPPRGDVQATPEMRQWAAPGSPAPPAGGEPNPTPPATAPTTPAGVPEAAKPRPVSSADLPSQPPRRAEQTRGVRPSASRARAEQSANAELYAGALLLSGTADMPVAVAPAIGFSFQPTDHWGGTIQAWGPAMSHVRATEGSAKVDQEGALAHLEFEPARSKWVRPFARLGVGAYRLGVSGEPNAVYPARSDQAWSGAGSLGVGARSAGLGPLVLLLAADAVVLAPRPGVVFAGSVVARAPRPMFVGQLGAGVQW